MRPERPRRVQHADGAALVHPMRAGPILVAARHRGDGREMKAPGDPRECGAHRLGIGHIATHHLAPRIEIFAAPGREIVQHAHAMSGGEQCVAEVRADEPGAAGDEIEGGGHVGDSPETGSSWPGSTRPSSAEGTICVVGLDGRVKPGHDGMKRQRSRNSATPLIPPSPISPDCVAGPHPSPSAPRPDRPATAPQPRAARER